MHFPGICQERLLEIKQPHDIPFLPRVLNPGLPTHVTETQKRQVCNADSAVRERDYVIEDVGPELAVICSCVVVESVCMFSFRLCNDAVINVMTLSLAEKDVLYSMATAGPTEKKKKI